MLKLFLPRPGLMHAMGRGGDVSFYADDQGMSESEAASWMMESLTNVTPEA